MLYVRYVVSLVFLGVLVVSCMVLVIEGFVVWMLNSV